MAIEYPLYLRDNATIILVVDPLQAYVYKDFTPRIGFEFKEYTTRKMVRKLEKTGEPVSPWQFGDMTMSSMGVNLRNCFNSVLKCKNISESEQKAMQFFNMTTFTSFTKLNEDRATVTV